MLVDEVYVAVVEATAAFAVSNAMSVAPVDVNALNVVTNSTVPITSIDAVL